MGEKVGGVLECKGGGEGWRHRALLFTNRVRFGISR